MSEIRDAARNVLEALIRLSVRHDGRSPTLRELARESKRSLGPVQRQVAKLEAGGYIRRHHGARPFEILRLPDGRAYYRPHEVEWQSHDGRLIHGWIGAADRAELGEAQGPQEGLLFLTAAAPLTIGDLAVDPGDILEVEDRPASNGELSVAGRPFVRLYRRVR